jgi:zinc protease
MDFYAAHYEPANAILIVAGDVTPDEVKTLAERYYGPLKNKLPAPERARAEEPQPNAERRITMSDPRVSSPSWQRQYLTPAARQLPQREELAMSLLAEIIGGSNQSRFYQTLNLGKKLAAYSGAWFDADQLDYGSFSVYAAPNPGVSVEAVETEVDAILADVAAKGVTQEELDRSRNSMIASAVYLLDSQDKLARLFGVALATGQTIDDVRNWDKDLATVTVDDVNKAARTILDRKASVTGVLLPEEKKQ